MTQSFSCRTTVLSADHLPTGPLQLTNEFSTQCTHTLCTLHDNNATSSRTHGTAHPIAGL